MGETHYLKEVSELAALKIEPTETVIWTLCHYPDHEETEERARRAKAIHEATGAPIWLFGSSSATYPESVEALTKNKMMELGIPADQIFLSAQFTEVRSLDTIQEMMNVTTMAKKKRIKNLICISNSLHLMQIHAFLRKEKFSVIYFSSKLKDWRWWYLAVRLTLAPLAYAGFGKDLIPLRVVRHARSEWKKFRI
jgi:uncharacterized SAM-binding protein YcdF (DUF218 family)